LQRLTGQIRRLTERVFESSTLNVRNRIYAELLRLAKKHPMEANRVVISPAPIQADLASLIGTVRETVSRELADLEREQVILQQDHEIHILDMAKLTEMVENVRGNF
jgi:CRP/FNR family cyclic AMP-dependent transcriptional regulator